MAQASRESPCPSPLKIHSPSLAAAFQFGPDVTLSAFYAGYVEPICLASAAPRNREQYQGTMRLWVALTGDPQLRVITNATCAAFVASLVSRVDGRYTRYPERGGRLSPNTVRKHCAVIGRCLSLAGEPSRSNRLGAGLLEVVPWLEAPPMVLDDPDGFTVAEVERVLEATRFAKRPEKIPGVSAPAWWAGLILFDHNTGLRLGELLALRWSWIREDEAGSSWLHVPAEFMKGRRRGRRVYLNRFALAALASIRGERELIFPWPHCPSWLHECRLRILEAAGLPPERRFGFHGLRKRHITEVAMQNAMAAQLTAGHTSARTTIDHYTMREVLVPALDALPQPKYSPGPEQLRLFD